MKLAELRIAVTGAASGLGRAFSLGLARLGAKVAAMDVNTAGLAALARDGRDGPGSIATFEVNVSRQDEVAAAVQRAFDDLSGLNGLVNNAGIYRDGSLLKEAPDRGTLLKMPLAQWQTVIDTDLTGPFLMTREVAARMIERRTGPGVIINISSVSRHGNAGQANYAAAKAGVVASTVAWARELARYQIRVAAIAPGFVETPILGAMAPETLSSWIAKTPLGRLGTPDEILLGLRFIVECDYFTGRCLDIDGGLSM